MKSRRYVVVVVLAVVVLLGFWQSGSLVNGARMVNALRHVHAQLRPFVIEMQSELTDVRTTRPDQLNPEDIHAGDILYEVHKDSESMILVVKPPYMNGDDCKFDYVWWENNRPKGSFIWSGYCSDAGMVEYSGPLYGWNPTNYLKSSGESPLTQDEAQKAIENLKPEPTLKPTPNNEINL